MGGKTSTPKRNIEASNETSGDFDETTPIVRRRHRGKQRTDDNIDMGVHATEPSRARSTETIPTLFPEVPNGKIGIFVVNSTKFYITVRLSIWATWYFENSIKPGEIFYIWPEAVWFTVTVHPTGLVGKMTKRQREKELAIAFGGGAVAVGVATAAVAVPVATGGVAIDVGIAAAGQGLGSCKDAFTKGVSGASPDVFTSECDDDKNKIMNNLMDKFINLERHLKTDIQEVALSSMGWILSEDDVIALLVKYGDNALKAFERDVLLAVHQTKNLSTSMKRVYAGNLCGRDGSYLEVSGGPAVVKGDNGRVKIIHDSFRLEEHEDFDDFRDTFLRKELLTKQSYKNYFGTAKPRQ